MATPRLTFAKVLTAEHARIAEIEAKAATKKVRPVAPETRGRRPIARIFPAGREFFSKQLEAMRNWWARTVRLLTRRKPATLSAEPRKSAHEYSKSLGEALSSAHAKPHAALCLSGGGIRSATFNLGILQGLGKKGLLNRFHYLSTVSGGGFIGGWLSAWTHRSMAGDGSAIEDIASLYSKTKHGPESPDPEPVHNLRRYSNYLSPQLGFFSADTWTLVSIYLRNVLLNALVLIPFLLAALMAPRVVYALMNHFQPRSFHLAFLGPDFVALLMLIAGLVGGVVGIAFVGLNLPSIRVMNCDERCYLKYCLVPLVTSALSLATLWQWFLKNTSGPQSEWLRSFTIVKSLANDSTVAVALTLSLILVPWIICAAYARYRKLPVSLMSILVCTGLLALAGYITACILDGVSRHSATADPRVYATLSVPFILAAMMIAGTLISGITSRLTSDQDDEWWARSGAWLQIVVVGWLLLCGIVLWVPQLVLTLVHALLQNPYTALSTWSNRFSAIAAAVGTVATALSLFGGFSTSTPANSSKPASDRFIDATTLTNIAAAIALVFLLATLAAVTGPILAIEILASPFNHAAVLAETPLYLAVKATIGLLLFGYGMGVLIDTNKYSLHYAWRNRIVRAYLGASRDPHSGAADTSVAFTGFDRSDNIYMDELSHQLPLHVVNIALNLSGSKGLDWQERKAETFTVSPLHAGNYRIGYRPSKEYGGPHGISLGTAIAISGAAASPNMGYMMTSASVRFLMTLFNVRLGWWLGNPGPNGDLTYEQRSPRHIIRPLIEEALGLTDEDAPYVYLSDGGHFDNLGLYEMVLRRCHWIVVSDASTDPDYTYESLAISLRKIRIDLGISIEFEAPRRIGRFDDNSGAYCSMGTIHYNDVDGAVPDGRILYIKPSLTGSEPADVQNYARTSPSFPQEPISDQYFSESQFESYRALGAHIALKLAAQDDYKSLDELFDGLHHNPPGPIVAPAVKPA